MIDLLGFTWWAMRVVLRSIVFQGLGIVLLLHGSIAILGIPVLQPDDASRLASVSFAVVALAVFELMGRGDRIVDDIAKLQKQLSELNKEG